jgi:hypothetical protein
MTRHRLLLGATLLAALLCACATLPDDAPIVEKLDTETGVTVARLGKPVELYRDTFLKNPTGRFAFMGPFETNNMGERHLFLWLAVPVEMAADSAPPAFEVDGAPLALPTASREAASAGLRKPPYKLPTPWSSMYYYAIDAGTLAKLAAAGRISVQVDEPAFDGTAQTRFSAELGPDTPLRDFAARD